MSKKQLLIIYAGYTETGSTATLAGWIGQGASKYVDVVIKKAADTTVDDVKAANGFALGSGVYNGNPEPDMINFSEYVLNAGRNPDALDLSARPVGAFCTSGGYTTGAQPTLNALARILMTFSAVYVGGGNWETSQGVCGMVTDDKDGGWKWQDSMKSLQENATAYGERLGMITSFYQDAYMTAEGKTPPSPGTIIACDCKHCKKCKHHYKQSNNYIWVVIPVVILTLMCIIIFSTK